MAAESPPEEFAADSQLTMRGRSASPGQYGAHGYRYVVRPASSGYPRAESHGITTPRTPRTPASKAVGAEAHGTGELRLGVAVAEMHRQAEAERRAVTRQIQQLERRFQEQLVQPTGGRERWADLQGSVNGLLEEMSAMARRVESLDERLRQRMGTCEELVRQRYRELEQQVHVQEAKAALAASTSEELLKSQAAKLRKVRQTVEDCSRRLDSEEGRWSEDVEEQNARFHEIWERQETLEDSFKGLVVAMEAQAATGMAHRRGSDAEVSRSAASVVRSVECDDEGGLRALEKDLSTISHRTAAQLDEHASTIANLRVRAEGQEQRLSAMTERMETAVSSPIETLREEISKLREQDRRGTEARSEGLARRIQDVSEKCDEIAAEFRDQVKELSGDLFSFAQLEDNPVFRKMLNASTAQEQALQRLEEHMSQARPPLNEDLCDIMVRTEALEHRIQCFERGDGSDLSEKADRAELLRVEAAVREISEPLRRLSHRAASCEARSAAVERRVEQMQQALHDNAEQSTSSLPRMRHADGPSAGPRFDALLKQVADLSARVIDLEGLSEGTDGLNFLVPRRRKHSDFDSTPSSPADSSRRRAQAKPREMDVFQNERHAGSALKDEMAQLRAHVREVSGGVLGHQDEVMRRLAEGEEAATALRAQFRTLQDAARKEGCSDEELHQLKEGAKMQSSVLDACRAGLSDVNVKLDDRHAVWAAFKGQLEEVRQDVHAKLNEMDAGRVGVEEQLLQVQQLVRDVEVRVSGGCAASDLEKVLKRVDLGERATDTLKEDLRSLKEEQTRSGTEECKCNSDLHAKLAEGEASHAAHREKLNQVRETVAAFEVELSDIKELVGKVSGGLRDGVKEDLSNLEIGDAIEREVDMLRSQVEQDHRDLTQHQREFSSCRDMQAKLEAQVQDLSNKIAAELKAVHEERTLRAPVQTVGKACSVEPSHGHAELTERLAVCAERSSTCDGEQSSAKMADVVEELRKLSEDHQTLKSLFDESRTQFVAHEALFGDHRKDVDRIKTSSQSASVSFAERVEDVRHHFSNSEEAVATLRRDLERLRDDHKDMAMTRTLDADLSQRTAEVLRRISNGEEAINALRADLKVEQSLIKDICAQVAGAVRRVGSVASLIGPGRGDQPVHNGDVELQVGELQKQVEAELHSLANHQSNIKNASVTVGTLLEKQEEAFARLQSCEESHMHLNREVRSLRGKELSELDITGVSLDNDMEQEVDALTREVELEHRELAQHQRELKSFREVPAKIEAQLDDLTNQVTSELKALLEQREQRADCMRCALFPPADVPPRSDRNADDHGHLESRVDELARQVSSELEALVEHQAAFKTRAANGLGFVANGSGL